jgi:hypothetical protein
MDVLKGDAGRGILIGLAVAALTPLILPVLAAVGKPLARAAIKTGIIAYEKGREVVAEVGEVIEDLVAEARAELAESEIAKAAAAEQVVAEAEAVVAAAREPGRQ